MECDRKQIGPNDRDAAPLQARQPGRRPDPDAAVRALEQRRHRVSGKAVARRIHGDDTAVFHAIQPAALRADPDACRRVLRAPSGRHRSTGPPAADSVEKLRSVSFVTPPPLVPIQRLPSRSPVSDATELWFSPSLAPKPVEPAAAAPAHAAVGARSRGCLRHLDRAPRRHRPRARRASCRSRTFRRGS